MNDNKNIMDIFDQNMSLDYLQMGDVQTYKSLTEGTEEQKQEKDSFIMEIIKVSFRKE